MKAFGLAAVIATVAQSASAHYIFTTLTTDSGESKAAVRQPQTNSPVQDVTSADMTCNVSPADATETVSVAAGGTVGFLVDNGIGHPGPAAFYLGKAPSDAASWDGSGENWFKIAEWGAVFDPEFAFTDYQASSLSATIPAETPDGDYLLRVEQIGLHSAGAPQWYISCAQITVTGGGSGSPSFVSIPGHESADDSGLTVNIWWPIPTEYTVPGGSVWPDGTNGAANATSGASAPTSAASGTSLPSSVAITSDAATDVASSTPAASSAEASAPAATSEAASTSKAATSAVLAPSGGASSAAASSPAASSPAASGAATSSKAATSAAATGGASTSTAAAAPATSSSTSTCTKDAYNCCWDAYNACAAQANSAQAGKGGNVDFSACSTERQTCLGGVSRRHARMWAAGFA